jgi:NitT/TauT family transport system substrate-binding protein
MKKINRTKLIVLCVLLVCINFVCIRGAVSQETKNLKFYYQPTISRAPIYIACEEGFFKEQGINLEFVKLEDASQALILLMQGSLDAMIGPVTAGVFNAVAGGKEIKFVAGAAYFTPGDKFAGLCIRKNSNMRDFDNSGLIKALKNKKIANVIYGDFAHYFIDVLINKNGLSLKDIELVMMPFPAIVGSIEKGTVDAGLLTEPFITSLKDKNLITLIPYSEIFNGPCNFLIYGPNLLLKDREKHCLHLQKK